MTAMIIDQIIRSRRKTISLVVTSEGKLVVRAPLHFPQSRIVDLVNQKTSWIEKKLNLARKNRPLTTGYQFVQGSQFWYLGKLFELSINNGNSPVLCLDKQFHLAKKALPYAERVFIHWYREQARRLFAERASFIANRYGFKYRKIMITSAQTRWGSCSTSGTLSFPWRLVMAPPSIIDYVVVHELVHTIEKNHQKKFWERVAAIEPDYKNHIQWLKENGPSLRIGR